MENILKYAREQRHHAATDVHTTTSNIAQLAYKKMHGGKKNIKGYKHKNCVLEAYSKVENVDERTNTKQKTEQLVWAVMKRNNFSTTTQKKGKVRAFENLQRGRQRF